MCSKKYFQTLILPITLHVITIFEYIVLSSNQSNIVLATKQKKVKEKMQKCFFRHFTAIFYQTFVKEITFIPLKL